MTLVKTRQPKRSENTISLNSNIIHTIHFYTTFFVEKIYYNSSSLNEAFIIKSLLKNMIFADLLLKYEHCLLKQRILEGRALTIETHARTEFTISHNIFPILAFESR